MTTAMLYDEDPFEEALTLIDLSRWGVRARILMEVRRLSLRSDDGWARVSYRTLALRLGCSERYLYDLIDPKNGVMWKVERVLIRGPVGRGRAPTCYQVNPFPSQWRCVPWVADREIRRRAFGGQRRAPDRGTRNRLCRDSYRGTKIRAAGRLHLFF